MSNDTRIAVDVAKAVFELAISDRAGHVARRERLPRALFPAFMAQQPAATVVMEACGSAHHWAREIQKLGHRVVLLPPHHARPYIRRNKTDRNDAKGILEASRNDDIRPVPVKTVHQQVLTSLHRLRSGWMLERTARLNALRGLLRELGVFIPVGSREVVPAAWSLIEDAGGLKRHLGRISKRGDGYLRTLLIHGARSLLLQARRQQPDRLREWANNLAKTHVHNKAAVAVANKLARIVWAVWKHERPFALMAKAA